MRKLYLVDLNLINNKNMFEWHHIIRIEEVLFIEDTFILKT